MTALLPILLLLHFAAEASASGLEALASEHATEECIFDVLTRAVEVSVQ